MKKFGSSFFGLKMGLLNVMTKLNIKEALKELLLEKYHGGADWSSDMQRESYSLVILCSELVFV